MRGASRGVLEWGGVWRLRAGADVPPALGTLRVAVRAHYEALPLVSWLDAAQAKAGEIPPDKQGFITRTCARKHGPEAKSRHGGAPEGVSAASGRRRSDAHAAATNTKVRLSALRRPSTVARSGTSAKLGRRARRENADVRPGLPLRRLFRSAVQPAQAAPGCALRAAAPSRAAAVRPGWRCADPGDGLRPDAVAFRP